MKKTALVIGASRGIGRQIALTLARNDFSVVLASKTLEPSDKLPGSITSVAKEINDNGGSALPLQCDCRNENDIQNVVNKTFARYGRLDAAVYNAGAILWKPVLETPLKRFDLMMNVNVRGAYSMIQDVVPRMIDQKSGRIVLVAPPIYNRFFKGKTPYSISKVGMTILVKGLAHELTNTGVSISALWPTTAIKAHVTDVLGVPNSTLRKPDIFADAVLKIVNEPTNKLNGQALLDEDYLRLEGVTDFTQYQCDPGIEPPRMMPRHLPDLTVEEENESLNLTGNSKSKL
ncbi:hypothetical protein ACF0H5_006768 [Mactra antiquata]